MGEATAPPQDTPDERWLPVVGYEGLYWVSDTGRVWSKRRKGSSGGILRQPPPAKATDKPLWPGMVSRSTVTCTTW